MHISVGCGTGRNFDYYANSSKVIAVDAAASMVQEASKKVQPSTSIMVQQMDAHQLSFPDKSFDTVVDTFGLCSYQDPVHVLRELQRVCKDNGQVLLIEHGRGSYDWINRVLDNGAHHHAHNWGCIWNRDISELLQKAGLEVVSMQRFHFGTTYLIEAKPVSTLKNPSPAP